MTANPKFIDLTLEAQDEPEGQELPPADPKALTADLLAITPDDWEEHQSDRLEAALTYLADEHGWGEGVGTSEFARLIGVDHRNVRRWVDGSRMLSVECLVALLAMLGDRTVPDALRDEFEATGRAAVDSMDRMMWLLRRNPEVLEQWVPARPKRRRARA